MGIYSNYREKAVEIYPSLSSTLSHTSKAKQIAKDLNFDYDDSFRRVLLKWVLKSDLVDHNFENETTTQTNQYLSTNNLSAKKPDGTIMDIGEYCETYGIPIEHVRSFKLITHTAKGAYYNIASANLEPDYAEGFDVCARIEELISTYQPTQKTVNTKTAPTGDKILQLVFSDTHLNMDVTNNGQSLYGGSWTTEDILERANIMAEEFVKVYEQVGSVDCIQVLQLGDFADGLDGETVRKGHHLPQLHTNQETFDLGVKFLTTVLEQIYSRVSVPKIIWYNVCNSNHSTSFDYFMAQAFKGMVEVVYGVEVINERKFIGHFSYGNHTEIITHGKDGANLKFGFKAQLDVKGRDKIQEYIRFHKLDRDDRFIQFHKGDSHQHVTDRTASFDFNSYLALSPSSDWVQTNFQSGRSGFSVIVKEKNSYKQSRHDFEFQWGNNKLK